MSRHYLKIRSDRHWKSLQKRSLRSSLASYDAGKGDTGCPGLSLQHDSNDNDENTEKIGCNDSRWTTYTFCITSCPDFCLKVRGTCFRHLQPQISNSQTPHSAWTPALAAPDDQSDPANSDSVHDGSRAGDASCNTPKLLSENKGNKPLSAKPSKAENAETGQVLKSLQWELNRIQRTVRLTLQSKLQDLVGQSLSSLNENRELANSIQKILDTHSLRIRCPQCGHASILRVSPRKGMPGGAFVLDHTIDGKRTFHGGSSSVPPIQLTAKPERKATASTKTRPQPATAGQLQSKVS